MLRRLCTVERVALFCSAAALTALIVSGTLFVVALHDIQVSRQRAVEDTCRALTQVVLQSDRLLRKNQVDVRFHRRAVRLLAREGLSDCHRYAQSVTSLPSHRP